MLERVSAFLSMRLGAMGTAMSPKPAAKRPGHGRGHVLVAGRHPSSRPATGGVGIERHYCIACGEPRPSQDETQEANATVDNESGRAGASLAAIVCVCVFVCAFALCPCVCVQLRAYGRAILFAGWPFGPFVRRLVRWLVR